MKTTIDLADDLAISLKKRTAREGISMRTAVHQALRMSQESARIPCPKAHLT